MLLALMALVGISLFSTSSASLRDRNSKRVNARADATRTGRVNAKAKSALPKATTGLALASLFLQQPPPPTSVETFDGTGGACGAAKTEFNLGQEVCAQVTSSGGAASRRRITWQDPEGNVRKTTAITADPQSDNFAVPSTPTTTLSNGQIANNVGKWRVSLVGRSLVTYAVFVVKDPANATADLSITKVASASTQEVAAGANGSFDIYLQNGGPDDAKTVSVVDHVPANTTFVSLLQTGGQAAATFTCTTAPDGNGNVTCSVNTLPSGASATFSFIYTVNAGTAAGTVITNTVSIASTTHEGNGSDNSATASANVAGTPSSGVCAINCPEDIVVQSSTTNPNNPNQRGAVVHFDPPGTEGSCGPVTVDHCNDCFFPEGNTLVTATATTGESCSFTITVSAPSNAPTIACPANQEVDAQGACQATVSVGQPTVSGGENVTVFGVRSDGKPMYDCDAGGNNCVRKNPDLPFAGGLTTITWTATSHNSAGDDTGTASCTQTITVNNASDDTTNPVISCPAGITRSNDPGECSAQIAVGSATATDNCDNNVVIVGTRSDNEPLDAPYPKGSTTITWTATDASGNSSSCEQTITVNDTENPTISCPANITRDTDPGTCSANVNPGTATATDNCGSATVTGTRSDSQPLSAPYPSGTTTITWRATDSSGNYSECTQTVTVTDHENPVIACPPPIVTGTDPGTCSAIVNLGQPTATDNCGSPTVTGTRSDGQPLNAPYPKGTTTITWRATDSSGNYSECTQTVTVNDTESPVITFTTQNTLWPPNHAYHTFTPSNFVTGVSDNCDSLGVGNVYVTKITSDEVENGNGDGNTMNDIVIAADCKSFQLRAEREGNGNGRVYTIFFSVRDAAGNVGTGTAKVVVPKNPNQGAVDSGPHYTVNSNCP